MHLLYKPIPNKNESPGSLLLRATENNGWQSISSFLAALGYNLHYGNSSITAILSNQEKWDRACKAMYLDLKDASQLCYQRSGVTLRSMISFNGMSIPWGKLRLAEPAFCPLCLKEEEFIPSYWDFTLISVCPTHKVKLLTICPNCRGKLHWNRRSISLCNCGYDLRQSQTEKAKPRATKFIYDLLEKKDSKKIHQLFYVYDGLKSFLNFIEIPLGNYNLVRLAVFCIIKPAYLERVITKIVKNINLASGMHPRIILHPFLISNSRDLVDVANTIIESSAINLRSTHKPLTGHISLQNARVILGISIETYSRLYKDKYLEGYQKNGQTGQSRVVSLSSLNSLIFRISHNFSSIVHDYSFPDPIINQLTSIVKTNERTTVNKILEKLHHVNSKNGNKQTKELSKKGYLTISEAANVCDVYYENIRFAIHCRILNRLPANATKGTQIFISETDVHEFNRKYIFTKGIAKKYKVNPTNIAEKIISTGTKAVSGPGIDGGLTYLFYRHEIDPLDLKEIAKIKGYPTRSGRKKIENRPIEEHSISLSSAAKALRISTQKASQLMHKGFLTKCINNQRAIFVTYKSFKKVYGIKKDPDYLTVEYVAHSLGDTIKEFLKRYIDTKIICQVFNGLDTYLTLEDKYKIEKFKKRYITSKEAAEALGASGSFLNNLNKMGKIKPAKIYEVGKNKIYFYNLKALIKYCESQNIDSYSLRYRTKHTK